MIFRLMEQFSIVFSSQGHMKFAATFLLKLAYSSLRCFNNSTRQSRKRIDRKYMRFLFKFTHISRPQKIKLSHLFCYNSFQACNNKLFMTWEICSIPDS